ncbi:hypothetical protein [uncultured Clostridium sp.]|uniref:hypothetical protein n=1 Tax=uncultured Clostridium sp. TaxID=59620 RepID=UPI0037DDBDD4
MSKLSSQVFYDLVTLLNISVDKYFYYDSTLIKNNKRRQIETQMDSFNDKELMLIESLAKGIIRSKKIQ